MTVLMLRAFHTINRSVRQKTCGNYCASIRCCADETRAFESHVAKYRNGEARHRFALVGNGCLRDALESG